MVSVRSNGWTTFAKIGGLLVVIGGIAVSIITERATVLRDLREMKNLQAETQSSQAVMAKQVADIHASIINRSWESYSAWNYQIQWNKWARTKGRWATDDMPEPPEFLMRRPGYDGQ